MLLHGTETGFSSNLGHRPITLLLKRASLLLVVAAATNVAWYSFFKIYKFWDIFFGTPSFVHGVLFVPSSRRC